MDYDPTWYWHDELAWRIRRAFRRMAYRLGYTTTGWLGVGPLRRKKK